MLSSVDKTIICVCVCVNCEETDRKGTQVTFLSGKAIIAEHVCVDMIVSLSVLTGMFFCVFTRK